MKDILLVSILAIFMGAVVQAEPKKFNERWYQEKWCQQQDGITEFILPDRTRVDCLTDTHAIEFDWAKKWVESAGQSMHYAKETGKTGGVVLIIENENDWKYFNTLKDLIEYYNINIDLWSMEAE